MKDNSTVDSSSKKVRSNNSVEDSKASSERFIIQIERPGEKPNMATIGKLLSGTGIKLDPNYGPYCVNPKLGRYVVRGIASQEAQQIAAQIPGITLFPDAKVSPDAK